MEKTLYFLFVAVFSVPSLADMIEALPGGLGNICENGIYIRETVEERPNFEGNKFLGDGNKLIYFKGTCTPPENQPYIAYQSLYLSIYVSLTKASVTDFLSRFLRKYFTSEIYTKLGNDSLYCVLKNQLHIAYKSLYLSNFLSLLQELLLHGFSVKASIYGCCGTRMTECFAQGT